MATPDYYIVDNADIESRKLEAAKNHYLKGDYVAALKLYSDMLNTSISYKLYYEIGRCYYKMNDLLPAIEYFKKSTALEILKNPSYLYLGNLYYKQGDLNNAIENWVAAYGCKPDDEAVCLNLAMSYFTKKMKFQSIFYYDKYLKYAQNKNNSYFTIKESIDKCKNIAQEFYYKGERAFLRKEYSSAIEYLTFSEQNYPINFDTNYFLGSAYLALNDNMHAMIYLKQALCIDNKSLDTLQKLSSVFINLGDYTGAYCTMRRLLPLVIHNQPEYLRILKIVKELDATFDNLSYQGHKQFADKYYADNNYSLALFEYENCLILNDTLTDNIKQRIEQLKYFLYPEERFVKSCLEKGCAHYNEGNFMISNKYFSKVMLFSSNTSSEYKLAKSRITNV